MWLFEVTEKKLLSETAVPQTQPASICSNAAILTVENCKICSELAKEAPGIVLAYFC